MTTFSRTWNAGYEANPADIQDALYGATRVRELKADVRERLEVDHSMVGDAADGAHKKVTLLKQASDPADAADTGFLYTKDVSGVTELFYKDSDGAVIQVSSGGVVTAGLLGGLAVTALGRLAVAAEWTAQQNFDAATLAYASPIAWDLSAAQVAAVTLSGNTTLSNPTNAKDGGTYILRVVQDGTGSRTLAFGTNYKWPSGVAPVLSTDANAVDVLYFTSDGVSMYGTYAKDFS